MLTLSRNAEIALKTLPPVEQAEVLMSLDHLEHSGNVLVNGSIQKLRLKNQAAYDEVYIMRATRQFRVIFAVEDQQQEPESKEIIVLDIFDRDRLTTMYATRIANEEF